jgi:hypothetical protein
VFVASHGYFKPGIEFLPRVAYGVPSSLAKTFRRAYRRLVRRFGDRRHVSRLSLSPRQSEALSSQPVSACLLHRGSLETFLFLQSLLPRTSRQLDPSMFLEFLVRDGEIAQTPPPMPVPRTGLPQSVLCVGGIPSDTPGCFLTSAEFNRLLSASMIPALEATLQNVVQLVILDEKASSLLLISREAMGVINRRVSRSVTLYGNFTCRTDPTFCPDGKKIYFPPPWLSANAFHRFPNQSLHGPRLGASGWITGQYDMRDASDPGALPDRWLGYASWSRY